MYKSIVMVYCFITIDLINQTIDLINQTIDHNHNNRPHTIDYDNRLFISIYRKSKYIPMH